MFGIGIVIFLIVWYFWGDELKQMNQLHFGAGVLIFICILAAIGSCAAH